jgi:hypothetical protein
MVVQMCGAKETALHVWHLLRCMQNATAKHIVADSLTACHCARIMSKLRTQLSDACKTTGSNLAIQRKRRDIHSAQSLG